MEMLGCKGGDGCLFAVVTLITFSKMVTQSSGSGSSTLFESDNNWLKIGTKLSGSSRSGNSSSSSQLPHSHHHWSCRSQHRKVLELFLKLFYFIALCLDVKSHFAWFWCIGGLKISLLFFELSYFLGWLLIRCEGCWHSGLWKPQVRRLGVFDG